MTDLHSMNNVLVLVLNNRALQKHFLWCNVFNDMCRKGRWSFWSSFDEDMHETIFTFSFPVTLTFDRYTLYQRCVSTKL